MRERIESDGASVQVYRAAPSWNGLRAAALGDFRCNSIVSGAALLSRVSDRLKSEGFGAILGPMSGDTWHSYRLVTETDGSPPFLMEPQSKPCDLPAFEAAGFDPVARYFSARVATADALGVSPARVEGLSVTPWDGHDPEAHFAQVHDVSLQAFARNAFYAPISREAFLAMYLPLVPMMRPDLVLMARAEGRLVGFLFGVPNWQEGRTPRTVILKTYASLLPGVGHHLAHAFHSAALAGGFATTIHALIHEDNASALRSRLHGATVFRRYALMGLRLG